MEKPTPHCKLTVVKAFVEAGKVRATRSARLGATALGLELSDMLAVVMALTPADFYKSMTTHADHTVWQDVYRPSTQAGDVYLKLTVINWAIARVAVGTEIAPRPPHRSVRAALPHTAPALSHDAKR